MAAPVSLWKIAPSVYLPALLYGIGQGAIAPVVALSARGRGGAAAETDLVAVMRAVTLEAAEDRWSLLPGVTEGPTESWAARVGVKSVERSRPCACAGAFLFARVLAVWQTGMAEEGQTLSLTGRKETHGEAGQGSRRRGAH